MRGGMSRRSWSREGSCRGRPRKWEDWSSALRSEAGTGPETRRWRLNRIKRIGIINRLLKGGGNSWQEPVDSGEYQRPWKSEFPWRRPWGSVVLAVREVAKAPRGGRHQSVIPRLAPHHVAMTGRPHVPSFSRVHVWRAYCRHTRWQCLHTKPQSLFITNLSSDMCRCPAVSIAQSSWCGNGKSTLLSVPILGHGTWDGKITSAMTDLVHNGGYACCIVSLGDF